MKQTFILLKTFLLILLFLGVTTNITAQDCGFVRTYNKPIVDQGKAVETTQTYEFKLFNEDKTINISINKDGTKKSIATKNTPADTKTIAREENFVYTGKINANQKIRIKKINLTNGNTVWAKGINLNFPSGATNIQVTEIHERLNDNGNLELDIAGSFTTNIVDDNLFLIKTNEQGGVIWKKKYNNTGDTVFKLWTVDNNGDLYVERNDRNTRKQYLRKYNNAGDFLWESFIGFTYAGIGVRSVVFSPNEAAVYLGVYDAGLFPRAFVKKYNSNNGNQIWNLVAQEVLFPNDGLHTSIIGEGLGGLIAPFDGNGGVVMGYKYRNESFEIKYGVGRINSDGTKGWSTQLSDKFTLTPRSVTTDNGFLFSGEKNGKLAVVKFNSEGKLNCVNNTSDCPDQIDGFTALGELNGSKYFLSNDVSRPTDAQATAESLGGNLVTINSKMENDFLYPKIDGLVYIGLNDEANEGTLKWSSGELFVYENFDNCSICQPNSNNLDFAVIQGWNGGWSWSNFFNQRKYIVEIDCDGSSIASNSIIGNTLLAIPDIEEEYKMNLGTIFPNPANNNIFASIESPEEVETEVRILDSRGVMVKSEIVSLNSGSNTVEISIADLPAGFYIIRVPNAQNNSTTKRFMKIRD